MKIYPIRRMPYKAYLIVGIQLRMIVFYYVIYQTSYREQMGSSFDRGTP